ncbi:MAG: helix-turn-helix domain-containing protein [Spirochaetes bacterium]|nr:helix-turn-helix domain-containing protein [Spirochaetota bacterium]
MPIDVGLKIREAGYSFSSDDYDIRQIIHVTEGELFIKEAAVRRIVPGATLVLFPHTAFKLFTRSRSYRGVYVIEPNVRIAAKRAASVIIPEDGTISAAARQVSEAIGRPSGMHREIVQAAGNYLAALVYAHIGDDKPEMRDDAFWIDFAKNLISCSLDENRHFGDIFRDIPFSHEHFTRMFKRLTGMSPKEYQMKERIAKACKLLAGTMNITSVAFESGYATSQHFAADFKTHTGMTPSAYRKKLSDGRR